ncbi:MAG: hypothetical protein ACKPCM_11565 [Pseudanabaena sp.]
MTSIKYELIVYWSETVTDDLTELHWIITAYTARKLTGGNS